MAETQCTVWMGNIRPHMDEHYIRSMLYAEPDVKNVKSVRDKLTGGIGQYCFVEFTSHQAAVSFIERNNGRPMPTGDGLFKLNWASREGPALSSGPPSGGAHTIFREQDSCTMFVGDLSAEVNEPMLQQVISQYFPSVISVKLHAEPGRPVNFAFVKFATDHDRDTAIQQLNGMRIGQKNIRCNVATHKVQVAPPVNPYSVPPPAYPPAYPGYSPTPYAAPSYSPYSAYMPQQGAYPPYASPQAPTPTTAPPAPSYGGYNSTQATTAAQTQPASSLTTATPTTNGSEALKDEEEVELPPGLRVKPPGFVDVNAANLEFAQRSRMLSF